MMSDAFRLHAACDAAIAAANNEIERLRHEVNAYQPLEQVARQLVEQMGTGARPSELRLGQLWHALATLDSLRPTR